MLLNTGVEESGAVPAPERGLAVNHLLLRR